MITVALSRGWVLYIDWFVVYKKFLVEFLLVSDSRGNRDSNPAQRVTVGGHCQLGSWYVDLPGKYDQVSFMIHNL